MLKLLPGFRFLFFALLLVSGMYMTGSSSPPPMRHSWLLYDSDPRRPPLGEGEDFPLPQAYSDFIDDEIEPVFGRVRTMGKLLDVLDDEKRRRSPHPFCSTYECSRTGSYGCNPTSPGKFGLIGPCCTDICCPVGDTQFGVCMPMGPCPSYQYKYRYPR